MLHFFSGRDYVFYCGTVFDFLVMWLKKLSRSQKCNLHQWKCNICHGKCSICPKSCSICHGFWLSLKLWLEHKQRYNTHTKIIEIVLYVDGRSIIFVWCLPQDKNFNKNSIAALFLWIIQVGCRWKKNRCPPQVDTSGSWIYQWLCKKFLSVAKNPGDLVS